MGNRIVTRDPSDGSVSVKEPQKSAPVIKTTTVEIKYALDISDRPVIDPTTSGLPTGSSKPENIARLEKSREWLKSYFHRKTEGT